MHIWPFATWSHLAFRRRAPIVVAGMSLVFVGLVLAVLLPRFAAAAPDLIPPLAPLVSGPSYPKDTSGNVYQKTDSAWLTGRAEVGSTVEVFEGATSLGTVVTNDGGYWRLKTTTLPDGPHSFTATATDASNNTSPHSAPPFTLTLDTVVPAAPVITSPANGTTTNAAYIVITGTAEPFSRVAVFDGSIYLGTTTAQSNGSWQRSFRPVAGTHVYSATATDTAGNTSTPQVVLSILIDRVAPAAPAFTRPLNAATITRGGYVELAGTAEVGSQVMMFDGNAYLGHIGVLANGTWRKWFNIADGAHTFRAFAQDHAGNISNTSTNRTVTMDTIPPTTPVITSPAPGTTIPLGAVTLVGTADAGLLVSIYDVNVLTASAIADGTGHWSKALHGIPPGVHDYNAYATDAAGNRSQRSNVVRVNAVVDAAPKVTSTVPSNGQSTVATNTNITVTFSESVNVTASAFTLQCPIGTAVPFTVLTASPATSFVLDPTANLPENTGCRVTAVASQVTDVDTVDPPDTMPSTTSATFVTDRAPTVTTITPSPGANPVATDTNIVVTFSESVNVTGSAFTLQCPNGTNRPFTVLTASPATSFVLDPTASLPEGVTCRVGIVGSQVSDNDAADPPDMMVVDRLFTFTTDRAPTVTSTAPSNGQNPVATNTNIAVTFSESVNVTASSFTLECPAGSTIPFTLTSPSPGTTFTLDPTASLPEGVTCTVTVVASNVSDVDSADPPNTMAADYVTTFTTDTAPTVSSTTPTNGATTVATDANVVVNFSEPVNVTAAAFTLECPSGTAIPFTVLTASPASSFTLDPTGSLPEGVTCTVTVVAAEVSDVDSANPPNTLAADDVTTFTTDAPPSVSSTTPTNGASTVATNTNIVVNFSESVNVTASAFTLECPSGSAIPFTVTPASPASSFTLDPTGSLAEGVTCTVTVVAAEVSDADSADPPDQMAADNVTTFTTDTAPTVSSTTPTNGATAVATDTNIVVNFSESVNVTGSAFTLECPSGSAIPFSVTPASPASSFTLDPTGSLAEGVTCTVTVVAAEVSDVDAGDPPDQMATDFVASFTTDTAPDVSSTTPVDGATSVATNADITVNFSESVNVTANAFTLECPSGSAIPFTVTPASPASSFTLNPTGNLPGGVVCTVTVVAAEVTDVDAGDPPDTLAADKVFSFTTNAPPTATAQGVSTNEDTLKTITLSASDGDDDNLTFSIVTTPGKGSLGAIGVPNCAAANICTATVDYTPALDTNGADSFTFRVNDGSANSSPATVTITVNPVNDAPTAVSDSYSTSEDSSLNVNAATGVLFNDTDVDNNPLTAVLVTGPAQAAIFSLNADGSFNYAPVANFNGSDSFTYKANDGTVNSNTVTVTITVTAVNDTPSASGQAVSTNEDTLKTITLSASDIDDDNLTFSIVTTPGKGSLSAIGVPNCAAANICTTTVDYTPTPDTNGADSFTFRVNDGTVNSTAATVTITVNPVNDKPVLANLESAALSFTEGDGATAVTANLTVADVDSPSLSTATVQITAGYENGADVLVYTQPGGNPVTGSFDIPTGKLTLTGPGTPLQFQAALRAVTFNNSSQNPSSAARTLSFRADDGAGANNLSDIVTRQLTVTAVNDPPVNTKPGAQTVNEDTNLVFSSGNGNAISIADVDAGGSTVKVSLDVSNGRLTLASVVGLTFVDGTANTQGAVHVTGTIANINTALSGLIYRGTANYNSTRGAESLAIVTNDQGNTGPDGAKSDSDTVAITVTAIADKPVAIAKSFTAQANMKINLTGLLTGATDPDDGDTSGTFVSTYTLASVTAVSCTGCNITSIANTNSGSFDLDPPAGGTASLTLQYTISDSGNPGSTTSDPASITVTVNGPVIWFVNPALGTNGDGRLSSPFNTLASAVAVDASGQRIFLYTGTATTGIALNTSEWLIGQGATNSPTNTFDALFGISPPSGTIARPSIGGTRPTVQGAVSMTTSSVVRGLNIAPASGTAGLTASSATSLTVSEVSVTTSSATAVNLTNSDGTFSFTAISANGGTSGIVWNNASLATGSFTVTGTGGAGSGGTIQQMNGDGIALNFAHSLSLASMSITTNKGNGIFGDNVTNFKLLGSSVTNNDSDNTDAVVGGSEAGIRFNGLFGTGGITNTTVSGTKGDNVRLTPSSGTLNSFYIDGSTLGPNPVGTGGNGIAVVTTGTANVRIVVTSSTFTGNQASGFLTTIGVGSSTIKISNSTFQDNNINVDLGSSGTGTQAISVVNNTILRAITNSVNIVGDGVINGIIDANHIGNGTVDSGSRDAYDIAVSHRSDLTWKLAITNNIVRNSDFEGIFVRSGDVTGNTGRLDLTVTGNTVFVPDDSSGFPAFPRGMFIRSRNSTTLCANIANNESQGSGNNGYHLGETNTSTFLLQGFNTDPLTTLTANNNKTGGGSPTLDTFGTPINGNCTAQVPTVP